MKPHHFHPEASDEYTAAAEYYAAIQTELGSRFYDEIERIISDIRHAPERFRQFDPPVRRHISTVFPYAVLYLEQPERIWIVAVMHTKRQPSYWRQRLK